MSVEALYRDRRLLVCVGPGGVGKTTLAAALALDAAERGRRVALITIDPARRLAGALGLDGLDDRLRRVVTRAPGFLDAAMLDTKASYDALIARITDDPAARARILENRVYQSFSRTLARSHAYVAMERLHDVLHAPSGSEHDLVVLDTPPTRSALDILDAPGRLVHFLDERVLAAFLGTSHAGAAAWLRARGGEVAMKLFGALVGERLVEELAGFFDVFFHLRRGFAERASAVEQALRAPLTSFVLVTAPERTHLADAAYLRDGLLERGVSLGALLFNRAYHLEPGTAAPLAPPAAYDPGAALAAAWPDAGADRELALAVIAAARALRAERNADDRAVAATIASFSAAAPASSARLAFPRLDEDPADLVALRALAASASAI